MDNEIFVYGGREEDDSLLEDFYAFNIGEYSTAYTFTNWMPETYSWREIIASGDLPGTRCGHTLTYVEGILVRQLNVIECMLLSPG